MIRWVLALAAGLWAAAAARDGVDRWVDATVLPSLALTTSVEVVDRNGDLLRAYTMADGRWRLLVSLHAVDPTYLALLIRYEDKRFYDHAGVDPLAMLRAMGQALRSGRVVSGGSTLTMQVARLLENGGTGEIAGALDLDEYGFVTVLHDQVGGGAHRGLGGVAGLCCGDGGRAAADTEVRVGNGV